MEQKDALTSLDVLSYFCEVSWSTEVAHLERVPGARIIFKFNY